MSIEKAFIIEAATEIAAWEARRTLVDGNLIHREADGNATYMIVSCEEKGGNRTAYAFHTDPVDCIDTNFQRLADLIASKGNPHFPLSRFCSLLTSGKWPVNFATIEVG